MNILHPQIVTIGSRRYRKNTSNIGYQNDASANEPYVEETDDMFIENAAESFNEEPCDQVNCESYDNDYKGIEKIGDSAYKLTILVHESYFGFIIGRNADKKMKLEQETGTRVRIPKRGNKNDWLVIEGSSKRNIASCRNRINLSIIEARHRSSFTHLVTFPLTFEPLKTRFNEFQKEVLNSCGDDRGVDESIFQFPNKIHLTICTAVLLNTDEIEVAGKIMEDCCKSLIKDLIGSKPLKVNIKGLEYMNDDPNKVDVLYAKVEQVNKENAIQLIADDLMTKFCEAGLTKKQYDSVKLHATVMNTLKRQDNQADANAPVKTERESFDATNILSSFGAYDFGTYDLSEIHLSLRYSCAPNGYYECVKKISFK